MNMTLNIGDKVRFLNDVGGGRVSGFQKGGIVLVEDEDGFEIPVKQNEVVLVSASEKKLTQQSAPTVEEEYEEPRYRVRSILAGRAAPQQPQSYEPQYQAKEDAFDDDAHYNDSTTDTPSLEERMAQLERTVKKLQQRIDQLESAKSLRERLQDSGMKVTEAKKQSKPDRSDNMLEIDLHATELLDTTAGMGASDIKEYQLDIFRRTMKEHLKDKGLRIVFIHGNGDGVLRRAILNELRRDYSRCQWQDASFQQYGFGATMVTIR